MHTGVQQGHFLSLQTELDPQSRGRERGQLGPALRFALRNASEGSGLPPSSQRGLPRTAGTRRQLGALPEASGAEVHRTVITSVGQ